MLKLYACATILVDLHFTIHWDGGRHSQAFPPVAFAASVVTEGLVSFLQSLDAECMDRIRAATRYTAYKFDSPVNYEVERYFVWKGLENSKLSTRGISAHEFDSQIRLMKQRGYQDHVRVDMNVEIDAGEELRSREWSATSASLSSGSSGSSGSSTS